MIEYEKDQKELYYYVCPDGDASSKLNSNVKNDKNMK